MDSSRNVLGSREDLLLMSKTAMPLSLCESPSQYCGVHTVLTSFSWGRAGDPGRLGTSQAARVWQAGL